MCTADHRHQTIAEISYEMTTDDFGPTETFEPQQTRSLSVIPPSEEADADMDVSFQSSQQLWTLDDDYTDAGSEKENLTNP